MNIFTVTIKYLLWRTRLAPYPSDVQLLATDFNHQIKYRMYWFSTLEIGNLLSFGKNGANYRRNNSTEQDFQSEENVFVLSQLVSLITKWCNTCDILWHSKVPLKTIAYCHRIKLTVKNTIMNKKKKRLVGAISAYFRLKWRRLTKFANAAQVRFGKTGEYGGALWGNKHT